MKGNIPSPKLSEESINKMIEDYESGMSNLQIKVKYGKKAKDSTSIPD